MLTIAASEDLKVKIELNMQVRFVTSVALVKPLDINKKAKNTKIRTNFAKFI
jgi:hypothetical protein